MIVIPLASILIMINVLASIIQQFHYMFHWRVIKIAAFNFVTSDNKSLALLYTGTYTIIDKVLFLIRQSSSSYTANLLLTLPYRMVLLQC